MTTETALNGVIEEIANSIEGIVPNRQVDSSSRAFVLHDPTENDGKRLREVPGARRFELTDLNEIPLDYVGGHTNERSLNELMCTICYPRNGLHRGGWRAVGMDDVKEIRHWFGVNQGNSGVAGISARYVDYEFSPIWEEDPDDLWDHVAFRFLIWTDIDFT